MTSPSAVETPVPSIQWWLAAIVILGALLIGTGALLAIFATGEHLNSAGHNYADYFITRNLALAVMLLISLAVRARQALVGLMALTSLIQLLDAITAIVSGRYGLVPIDLIFAAVFLVAVTWLAGQTPWKAGNWRGDGGTT